MEYRRLPGTELEVSEIGLGSWVFGGDGWGAPDDARSEKVIREALEIGVNFFDTAPVYGSGRAEEIFGRVLSMKRDKAIIATKCGLEIKGSSIRPNLSPEFVRKDLENSLRRLRTERIDLYQCHWPDPSTPVESTMEELLRLREEGKVLYLGVSNFDVTQLQGALKCGKVVSNQVQYSILDPSSEEELLPFLKAEEVALIAYGALGGGILTGKYDRPPELRKGDVRGFFYKFYREPNWSRVKALVDVVKEVASEKDARPSQVALAWVLRKSEVSSCLVGCRSEEQLFENVGASGLALSGDQRERIDIAMDEIFKDNSS